MSKSELYDLLAYLDLEQYEKVVPEIEKKDTEIEILNHRVRELEKAVSRKEEQITDLDDENFDLENEIERLNNIIDKAIEYIESYNTDFKNCRFGEAPISLRELGNLLDILKRSDKE